MKIEQDFFIGFRDTNHLNELTNTALLAYLENMGGKHSDLIGNGVNDSSNKLYTWILLAWKVKVFKRSKFGDTIKVITWSREIEKFYAYRDFKVYNELGEIIAIASSKWVYIDIEKGKIIKVSEDIVELYQNELEYAFTKQESDFSKLVEPKNYSLCTEFKAARNMIDTNKHLHNIYYLDIAKEVIPEEIYLKTEPKNFEIMYKKEIKIGRTVKAYYCFENNKHVITIKNAENTEVHSIIVMY